MTFSVTIEPSGHQFSVESDETLLEAALRHGFNVPYGCRNGACASCKGRVLSGQVALDHYETAALSDEERAEGLTLLCVAKPTGDMVVEIREIGAVKDIPIKTMPARVAKLVELTPDVRAVFLKIPASERMQFLPGQYIDILLKDGSRRGFSLANSPLEDDLLELHIKRVPGGRFTGYVFEQMKEKDILRFEGPLGTFFLRNDSERPVLMVATGTGFAPIKSILQTAFKEGFGRPIHFLWGVRHEQDFYMLDMINGWKETYENFHFYPTVSRSVDDWDGRTGRVTTVLSDLFPKLSEFEAYLCGHPQMVSDVTEILKGKGVPEARIFSDAFLFSIRK